MGIYSDDMVMWWYGYNKWFKFMIFFFLKVFYSKFYVYVYLVNLKIFNLVIIYWVWFVVFICIEEYVG